MPIITLENAGKDYKVRKGHGVNGKRIINAVDDINLAIRQGEFVFLIGSSGAGKSTLLNLISGDIKPTRGKVCLDGRDLALLKFLSGKTTLQFGKVSQTGTLVRRMTVMDNLILAGMIGRGPFESKKKVRMRAEKVLGLVGMQGYGERFPAELSLGESRRIELARAMINSPPVLILDEVTANLDDDNIWDIFHLLTEINRRGTTVIMATHAGTYVNIMRRRVITLVDGKIYSDVPNGRYEAVRKSPQEQALPGASVQDFFNNR
ncbi:MAG: ATP-binding cassette domain-containing protein [Firmicutes bacterium]|nr:ATP-binding cassette domain-containing protein [Bacillota bacterium]